MSTTCCWHLLFTCLLDSKWTNNFCNHNSCVNHQYLQCDPLPGSWRILRMKAIAQGHRGPRLGAALAQPVGCGPKHSPRRAPGTAAQQRRARRPRPRSPSLAQSTSSTSLKATLRFHTTLSPPLGRQFRATGAWCTRLVRYPLIASHNTILISHNNTSDRELNNLSYVALAPLRQTNEICEWNEIRLIWLRDWHLNE